MPSVNIPLTKDDFINSCWQDVVNNSKSKECFEYSRAFWQKAQEAKEAGNEREQAVLEILAAVTRVPIKPESTEEFFAEIFQNLTDEQLNFLAEIVPEISDAELQSRVADILWIKRRDYRMAKFAVTAYLKSATELEDPQQWRLCFDRIERTLRLARKIKYKVTTVVDHIEAILDRYKGEDPLWLSAELMELLQEYRLGDPSKYAAVAEKAATRAESSHNWDRARVYWEIKAKWHFIENDGDKERAASMRAAETYVKEAEDSLKQNNIPYTTATYNLEKAVTSFRSIRGTREETAAARARAEEVHKLLLDTQQESLKEFISISSREIDIKSFIEQARTHVRGKEFKDALFSLALSLHPIQVSRLRQEVQQIARDSVVSQLFPIEIVNEMGKVVAQQPGSILSSDPNEAENATRFEMYRHAAQYQSIYAQAWIEPAREQINLEHSVRVKDLLSIVSHSPFVPPGREYLFAKGLYAGLTGDFFTSTHILIPQIENSIRYLLWERQNVRSSGLDHQGIQNEHQLTTTLYCPEITNIFDEDTLFDLKGLLVERSGSNLRNKMAHGLINDDVFMSPIMSYLWWLTLRLCCLPIWIHKQNVEQSDPWVRFAGMFKDDPLFDEFVEDMAAYRRELDAEIADYEGTSEENQSA